MITLLLGAAIASLPHVTLGALQRAEGDAAAAKLSLPDRLAEGWLADGARIVAWSPKFLTPAAAAERAYAGPAGTVAVYLAYYRGQSDESKLVSGDNVLLGMRDSEWGQVASGSREVSAGTRAITVRTAELLARQQSGVARRSHLVVWRVYWIDGRFVGSDVAAKVVGGLARLRGRGDEGAALVLYADGETVAASNAALEAFVKANLDGLDALLQHTRDAR